jgi:hypothetical protein
VPLPAEVVSDGTCAGVGTAAASGGAPGRSGRTPAGVELRAVGGEAELQVANDGARGTETTWGNGLTGLAERLAAGGGRLSAGPDGDRFVLAATVPVGVPA